jgi:hypothetical protein
MLMRITLWTHVGNCHAIIGYGEPFVCACFDNGGDIAVILQRNFSKRPRTLESEQLFPDRVA